MRDGFRRIFGSVRLSSVILILIGAVLLIHPDFGSRALTLTLGWMLVIAGGIGVAVSLYTRMMLGFGTAGGSLMMLLAGVLILSSPMMLASLFGLVLGAYLVFSGLGSFADARRLRSVGQPWALGMLWAAATALVGLSLILSPMTSSRVVMRLAGLAMIVFGAGSIVTHARLSRFLRDQDRFFDRLGGEDDDNIIDV